MDVLMDLIKENCFLCEHSKKPIKLTMIILLSWLDVTFSLLTKSVQTFRRYKISTEKMMLTIFCTTNKSICKSLMDKENNYVFLFR